MSTLKTTTIFLGAAVSGSGGTVTCPYPAGTSQTSFTQNDAADEVVLVNNNDRYGPTQVDIAYGASLITITNNSGVSWPLGARVAVKLAVADPYPVARSLKVIPITQAAYDAIVVKDSTALYAITG